MRKTNWKVILLIYGPFLALTMIFFIGGAVGSLIAWIPTFIVVKIFNLEINEYFDEKGNKITKDEYEKLNKKADLGFSWFPKRGSKKE